MKIDNDTKIMELAGFKLRPAPQCPDLLTGVMVVKNKTPKYALDEAGRLVGLNLAETGMDDTRWQQVADLLEREKVRLQALNVSGNSLTDFAPPPGVEALQMLDVEDNPNLENPPPEIIKRGQKAILAYFEELKLQGTDTLYEAKMLIIGEGGSGKTTLYRKLKDDPEMPAEKDSTRGIDIHALHFLAKQSGKTFTMHVWDFGGQEIYHATHQFFLTKRSLYVLVTDNRREDKNDYWLQVQKLYGEKSPMVVVQNEKGGRKKELPINEMRENFPNIQAETFALDLCLEKDADKKRFKELEACVEAEIQKQPHIGDKLPRQWLVIRKAIEELVKSKANPYISQKDYFELCEKHGIPEEERALRLSEYLHDLGVFLHFQDDVLLAQTLFLENTWVTDGVFALIDALNNKAGPTKWLFDEGIAKDIWCDKKYEGKYKDKIAELIALIEKFELCYEVSRKNYLIPQLLPGTRPKEAVELLFKRERTLQLHFEYGFMPKGLLSRLMVRLHRFIANQNVIWNSGMLLYHATYQTYAEVVETYGDRDIRAWVKGGRAKEFATVIVDEINLLNSTYGSNLKVTTFLPCICHVCRNSDAPYFYDYDALLKRRERSKQTIECFNTYEDVNVQQIIENVFVTPKSADPLKVFISYSKKDDAHKEALLTHLKPLQRLEELITWNDRNLLPGEDWDARIRQEINTADIVLVLLSSDALATDYIWEYEIKQAVEQSASGKSAVIPILVRPCDWASSPLARLSALPHKAKPITAFADNDEAWQQVVAGIREVVKRIKAWR